MSLVGFANVAAAAMVLAAVDELSEDEGTPGNAESKSSKCIKKPAASPKVRAKAKPNPRPKGTASKPKAVSKDKKGGGKKPAKKETPVKADDGEECNDEEQEQEDSEEEREVVPKKTKPPVLKRPASRTPKGAEPKQLKVSKYRYPTGRWAFKYGGREIMGASRQNRWFV